MAHTRIRYCPICHNVPVPQYRTMCPRCFDRVPWKMRADLMHAYRIRALNPTPYYEKLVEVRQWYDNALPGPRETEVADDGGPQ